MNASTNAAQKSQVWWSWPGGIGWPTPIPLKGGKRNGKRSTRKNRKASKKSRKANRKNRKTTMRRRR